MFLCQVRSFVDYTLAYVCDGFFFYVRMAVVPNKRLAVVSLLADFVFAQNDVQVACDRPGLTVVAGLILMLVLQFGLLFQRFSLVGHYAIAGSWQVALHHLVQRKRVRSLTFFSFPPGLVCL